MMHYQILYVINLNQPIKKINYNVEKIEITCI